LPDEDGGASPRPDRDIASIHTGERRPLAATSLHHKHAINNGSEFPTTAQIPKALHTPRKSALGHLHRYLDPQKWV